MYVLFSYCFLLYCIQTSSKGNWMFLLLLLSFLLTVCVPGQCKNKYNFCQPICGKLLSTISFHYFQNFYTFSVCCRIMTSFGKTLASTWNWDALKIVKIISVLLHCFDFSLPKVWMSWSAWTSMLRTWNLNRRISIIWLLTVWQVLGTHPSWRDFLRRILK